MRTVRLEIASLDSVGEGFSRAWKSGRGEQEARLSFATPELLWKVLTTKRWELLRALAGSGPLTVREVARRVERDVKAVHADLRALLDAGVIERGPGGRGFVFPYDAIHVDFVLKAA